MRLLAIICLAFMPLLPIMIGVPDFTASGLVESITMIALFSAPILLFSAIRLTNFEATLGFVYGGYLLFMIGHVPLLQGNPEHFSLFALALIPLILGFTTSASACAIGTFCVLALNYGIIVSGFAQHDSVSQTGLTLIAYSSAAAMICGLLVYYFTSLAQKESADLSQDNARIRTMALTDPLTRLWNRRAFQMDVVQLSVQYKSDARPALFILDLDAFKQINDTHGHDAGDQVLIVFSRRLKAMIGPGFKVYRLGGDEFAILCPNGQEVSDLQALGAKIAALTDDPIESQNTILEFDVSIGVALSDGSSKSIQSLYQQADMAAFVAKEKSGSACIVFDQMLDSRANRKFEVEQALKSAIEFRAINVAFQPQVDLRTGAITAYEALARWKDPALGSVSPGEFVEIAEETSLVKVLDRLIISKALLNAGTWLKDHQRVSVNASARSLSSSEFANFVIKQVEFSGLNPHQVEVEITETSLIQDWDKSKQTVDALRAAGVRIVLDDFGVGYSSLSYLVEFPVQKIKFDRSFLLKANDESGVLVMQSIADLANRMGVDLVAEGVETVDQLKLLKSINCFTGQGYLLSRPISADKMVEHARTLRVAA
ncbi:MAG: EAL domain-containing protein [Pseudomonadota bacterium]